LKNQEDTFAAELHRLKQQPLFSLVDFEQVVDRIRSTVAEVCLFSSSVPEDMSL
jgi:gamma-tubulin complex component 4